MPSLLCNYSAINRNTEREGGSIGRGEINSNSDNNNGNNDDDGKGGEEGRREGGQEKRRKRVRWYTNPQPQKRQRK